MKYNSSKADLPDEDSHSTARGKPSVHGRSATAKIRGEKGSAQVDALLAEKQLGSMTERLGALEITDEELRELRSEAVGARSVARVAVCDLALRGSIVVDDYLGLSLEMRGRLPTMSQRFARAMCASARAAEFRQVGN